MKKTNKPNPLKVFNDNNAKARMKAGGAMKEFKKSLKKAQSGTAIKEGPLSEEDTRATNAFNRRAMQSPSFSARQSFDRSGIESRINEGTNFVRRSKNFNTKKVANDYSEESMNNNWQGAPYLKKGGTIKKKMAVGGSSDSDCWPGKPGCGAEKARRVNKRRRFWNSDAGKTVKKVGAGVAAAGAGAAAYAKNVFKVKDAIKGLSEQKKGGSVKRKK